MPHQPAKAQELLTLGQVADTLGEAAHRVKYAIDTYRIKPVMRIGVLRVWDADGLLQIKAALSRIRPHQGG